MRATAENPEIARLMGVDVDRVIAATFILGAALAAVAGLMVGIYYGLAHYTMGATLGMKAFSAATTSTTAAASCQCDGAQGNGQRAPDRANGPDLGNAVRIGHRDHLSRGITALSWGRGVDRSSLRLEKTAESTGAIVNGQTAQLAVEAGADVLVAGTAVFGGGPTLYAQNISNLKR
jgi:hypothetical protein